MNFEYYLYQFLLKNHKAELSGFGVFLLTKESAKIDTENSVIIPPKENVTFRLSDNISDNQFAIYVSQQTKVDVEIVKVNLEKVISNWKYKLENEHYLSLENIGLYKLDADKNVVKVTDNHAEVYGLEEINLQSIKKSKSSNNKDYAMTQSVVWTFVSVMILGVVGLCYFGDMEAVFGKDSQIPPKQEILKSKTKKIVVKQDSIKQDSIKPVPNAEVENTKK